MPTHKRNLGLMALTCTWLVSIAIGLFFVCAYATVPGDAGTMQELWPAECQITLASDRHTLLMFVHPRCPCSRASLGELARTLAIAGDQLDARVIFFEPDPDKVDWTGGELIPVAKEIHGVQISQDRDGHLARAFGAVTSGHVLIYQPNGELVFTGGLTVARGHEGESISRQVILSLLEGEAESLQSFPVFGCPIITNTESE